jgi:glycosyltransferase involved in cell wall biosynthesis
MKDRPLRLLFVIKSLAARGGGAERVLAEITAGLAERGHAVTIASFDRPDVEIFYKFHPKVAVVALGLGEGGRHTRLAEAPARIAGIRRLLHELRPDVAVGFMHSAFVLLALAAIGTGVPVIASEHIVYGHYAQRPLDRLMLRLVAPLFSAITTISEDMRRDFPAPLRRRMVIMPNPVRAGSGTVAEVARDGAKTLLAVGRLEEQKDQATLIAAFALLAAKFPDWRLRIVGAGVLRPALESQIRELGLADRVELPGAIPAIDAEYRNAQLLAVPSHYESFGLVTAEALAHGLPVVGFADCPGTNELIEDGVNGVLVEGSDRLAALAAGLARLMGSAEERARLAAAAPASIAQFAPEPIIERWEALLRDLA